MTWIWIILALLYVLSRIDLIPDVLGAWGWLDDVLVLYLLYRYLRKASGRSDPATVSGQGNSRKTDPHLRKVSKEPHDVLEVAPDASVDEIRKAYRRLAAQYHPDRVTHLGAEFRELAETRFKEIQQAYDRLMTK